MIHRFPRLWSLFFDRSSQEQGEWAEALRENGVATPSTEQWRVWIDEARDEIGLEPLFR